MKSEKSDHANQKEKPMNKEAKKYIENGGVLLIVKSIDRLRDGGTLLIEFEGGKGSVELRVDGDFVCSVPSIPDLAVPYFKGYTPYFKGYLIEIISRHIERLNYEVCRSLEATNKLREH